MTAALENAKALYLTGIRDGEPREAVAAYTGARYTQHSTGVKDGQDGFIEFFEAFLERNPDREIDIVRAFEDGDFVFMHATQRLNGGESRWITMDILQADTEGRMIEHWDVITEWVDDVQVEGPREPVDPVLAAGNKALVERFIGDVLTMGRTDRIADQVSAKLIQHDPDIADGIDAWADSLASTRYVETPLVVGSGDMVATLSRVDIDGTEAAVMDLFRVADGRIVERWCAKEPVPPADELANEGKF